MSRTVNEILATLDNLAESWKTLGHPTQHKVQAEAVSELREHLVAVPPADGATSGKRKSR